MPTWFYMEKTTGGKGNVSLKLADRGLFEGAGRGGKRQLGAASILLELPNESSTQVRPGQRWMIREPSVHEFSERDSRLRMSKLSLRGHTDHGIDSNSGTVPFAVSQESAKDNIIFAESLSAPGVPVIYRPPEERLTNPDRLNLDRRHLSFCPILEGEDMLRLLNLQHNYISRIQHLGTLRRLVFLDLYDNKIEEISGLEGLHSLRVLMLGRNRIRYISGLDSLSKLDVLDLHGNLIRNISNLSHLSHLRVLNLAGNDISIVEGLNGLVSLAELNLRRNKITYCDVSDLSHLQRLFLSHNLIESFDDISSSTHCSLLTELSVDGNPLANDPNHRTVIVYYLTQLITLSQQIVTEEERKEATLSARQEEMKLSELQKQLKKIEEKETMIGAVKKDWENRQKVKGNSSYIEDEGKTLTLYGTPSLEVFKSNRLPMVTHLTLHYIDFNDFVSSLPRIKDTLPSLQHLHCGCMNLSTLLDLQTLSSCFPPSLTSLTLNQEGNPVTNHPFYTQWLSYLLPRVAITGTEDTSTHQSNLFTPLGNLHSWEGNSHAFDKDSDDDGDIFSSTMREAKTFAQDIQREVCAHYRRQQQFERLWPEIIEQIVREKVTISLDL